MTATTPKEVALRWGELYNDGTPEFYGSDRFLDLYTEDVAWHEMPSQFNPTGTSGNRAALREAVRFGQASFVDRRVDSLQVVSDGERAAMEYTWEATVGIDGLLVPRGTRLRAAVAQLITVRDGSIIASTEYLAWLPPANTP